MEDRPKMDETKHCIANANNSIMKCNHHVNKNGMTSHDLKLVHNIIRDLITSNLQRQFHTTPF